MFFALLLKHLLKFFSHGIIFVYFRYERKCIFKNAPSALGGHCSDWTVHEIWILFKSLHQWLAWPSSWMLHQHTVHSERVWLCYEKKSFLEVFHCYSLCHCVVKGHMSPMEAFLPVSWGRHWKMISAWNDLVPNTLLLFSTGSRTTFIHTGVELVDKKLSWKTMFYLYFVCLDGKTNEQTSPSSCCTEHRQAKAMIT